jgi:hypothetical protein
MMKGVLLALLLHIPEASTTCLMITGIVDAIRPSSAAGNYKKRQYPKVNRTRPCLFSFQIAPHLSREAVKALRLYIRVYQQPITLSFCVGASCPTPTPSKVLTRNSLSPFTTCRYLHQAVELYATCDVPNVGQYGKLTLLQKFFARE